MDIDNLEKGAGISRMHRTAPYSEREVAYEDCSVRVVSSGHPLRPAKGGYQMSRIGMILIVVLLVGIVSQAVAMDTAIVGGVRFTTGPITVDGNLADAGWTSVRQYDYYMPVCGDAGAGFSLKIARDTGNLYLALAVLDPGKGALPDWGDWKSGDYFALCWSPTGKHSAPFAATDRIIVIRRGGEMRVCNPSIGSQTEIGTVKYTGVAGGWSAECSLPLSALGMPGGEMVGLSAVLCSIGADGFANYFGSSENAMYFVDDPSVWQQTDFEQTAQPRVVAGWDLKSYPDNVPIEAYLGWIVSFDDTKRMAIQDPIREGWIECVFDASATSARSKVGAVDKSLKGAIISRATGHLETKDGRRVFVVSDMDVLPDVKIGLNPVAMANKAIGNMTNGLVVKLTGKVISVASGLIKINDGSGEVEVYGPSYGLTVGDLVSATGTCLIQADGSKTVTATEIINRSLPSPAPVARATPASSVKPGPTRSSLATSLDRMIALRASATSATIGVVQLSDERVIKLRLSSSPPVPNKGCYTRCTVQAIDQNQKPVSGLGVSISAHEYGKIKTRSYKGQTVLANGKYTIDLAVTHEGVKDGVDLAVSLTGVSGETIFRQACSHRFATIENSQVSAYGGGFGVSGTSFAVWFNGEYRAGWEQSCQYSDNGQLSLTAGVNCISEGPLARAGAAGGSFSGFNKVMGSVRFEPEDDGILPSVYEVVKSGSAYVGSKLDAGTGDDRSMAGTTVSSACTSISKKVVSSLLSRGGSSLKGEEGKSEPAYESTLASPSDKGFYGSASGWASVTAGITGGDSFSGGWVVSYANAYLYILANAYSVPEEK